MIAAAVLWPLLLGLSLLAAGLVTYRRDAGAASRGAFGLVAFGPPFVAAALAAFAGEHFTAAATLAQMVPKWLPAHLFIAYFVGVAHLAAASSIVARRYIRWSAIGLAIMFALFVLLMDLPAALEHPGRRIAWSLAARQATFSIGALALLSTELSIRRSRASRTLATIARLWTAGVLVFYGIEHLLSPEFAPGVPSTVPTAAWIPVPTAIAVATGILLIACGIAMFVGRYASAGAAASGLLMLVLTVALYVPQFFFARDVPQQVTAINFVFDTLLFAGMMFVVSAAVSTARSPSAIEERSPESLVPGYQPSPPTRPEAASRSGRAQ
jgi:uncharacterized membrane protein YphA (DoxX/SURF4 family)